ncbi:MAG TPA: aminotransferase class V-fold PLP-dependent enzyme [Chloroflexota bacterium]|jgi:isopenicillin-N epimerase|nr:aminotransferase class V-fold PLP-dependent enzyme [Chloroflexota bacterium]
MRLANRDEIERRHRALRDEFLLRPEVVFLNHGSYGACPRPVFERYQAWQLELERQPVEFMGRRSRELMAEARAALASYLRADPDEVVYFPNVTVALNVVARSLRLGPGDEVLLTDHEYGALERTWQFVCEKAGARTVVAPLPTPLDDPDAAVEALLAGLTERTRVLFLSDITSPTALVLPVRAVVAALRARRPDVLTVVDGAHAAGQIELDLHGLGVDFYGGNCHKWLSAPKGAGFLYARRDRQELLEPLVVSWGWRPHQPGPSRYVDEHEFQGTRDIAAYLSVPDAIRFQQERDWASVRAECHAMVAWFRQEMAERTGLAPLATSPDWHAQMLSVPLPPCDLDRLRHGLYDERRIELPLTRWHDQPGLRVSVQGYVTPSDLETLLEALDELLLAARPSG